MENKNKTFPPPKGETKSSPFGGQVIWLFMAGTALLSASWYMKPFPVFVFIGFAPFFAIVDYTTEKDNFWENSEMILLGFALFLFSVFLFDVSSLVTVLALAIIFTLPFLGFTFVRENLGHRTGKWIVIVFWLGIEFALLNIHLPSKIIFLADIFQSTKSWLRWNAETGYLGASAWILFVNWIVYAGILRKRLNWFLIFLALVVVVAPIVYSFSLDTNPILRTDMLELYSGKAVKDIVYLGKGELVARTCAWLSILIVLFAVVKSRITKK